MSRYRSGDMCNLTTGRAFEEREAEEACETTQHESSRLHGTRTAHRELRRGRKRVYRLKNGLLSLNKTPQHLIPVVQENSLSPLLSLPREIRTKIFEHVLGGRRILVSACLGTYFRSEGSDDPNHAKFDADRQLALLRVCRQIYSETATLAFSANVFCFTGREALETVWKRLLPAQRDAVRKMVVDLPLMLHYVRPGKNIKRLWTSPCAAFPNLQTMIVKPRSLVEKKSLDMFLEMVDEVRIERGLNVVME